MMPPSPDGPDGPDDDKVPYDDDHNVPDDNNGTSDDNGPGSGVAVAVAGATIFSFSGSCGLSYELTLNITANIAVSDIGIYRSLVCTGSFAYLNAKRAKGLPTCIWSNHIIRVKTNVIMWKCDHACYRVGGHIDPDGDPARWWPDYNNGSDDGNGSGSGAVVAVA